LLVPVAGGEPWGVQVPPAAGVHLADVGHQTRVAAISGCHGHEHGVCRRRRRQADGGQGLGSDEEGEKTHGYFLDLVSLREKLERMMKKKRRTTSLVFMCRFLQIWVPW